MNLFLKKYKIHIVIGSFFFVLVPLSIFGFLKMKELIVADITQKQNLQIQEEIQKRTVGDINEITARVAHIEENRDILNILLQDTDDAKIALFAAIEKIAEETAHSDIQLTVEKYAQTTTPAQKQPGDETPPEAFTVKPISPHFLYLHIRTSGTFNDAIAFLQKIDNMPYLSDVLSLSIAAQKAVQRNVVDATTITTEDDRENLVESDFYIAFYLEADEQLFTGDIPVLSDNGIRIQEDPASNADIDPYVTEVEGEQYLPMQESVK